jgi:hypothetical protein
MVRHRRFPRGLAGSCDAGRQSGRVIDRLMILARAGDVRWSFTVPARGSEWLSYWRS